MKLNPGTILEHYKGGKYLVLMWSKCSETKEDLVTYTALDDSGTWTREASMFSDHITNPKDVDGSKIPRFKVIADAPDMEHFTLPAVVEQVCLHAAFGKNSHPKALAVAATFFHKVRKLFNGR